MEIFGGRGDGGRSQALMLGVPAVVVSILGVLLLCVAEFGMAESLEERYINEAEKSTKEKQRLILDLRRELRMLKVTAASNTERGVSLIPEDDPRRVDLESNRKKEAIFLEKLISLNTAEPEYKFKLAKALLEKQDTQGRGLAMLRTISPADEPGHIEGHVFLAQYYLNTRTSNRAEAFENLKLALAHCDLCLRRDKTNITAMQIKGRLLNARGRYADAYQVFEELFKTNPNYFEALVDINQKLDLNDRNTEIINRAIDSFDDSLNNNEKLTDAERVRIFQQLSKCYVARKDFEKIETRLLEEIDFQSGPKDRGKKVWAEHLLANVYGSWLAEYPMTPDNYVDRLGLLEKAYVYNPKNDRILRELVRMGGLDVPAVAAAAREIYDPTTHTDAPALVLNELGAQSLARSEYDRALRYFELARKKTPQSPQILNNLAFTYLIGGTPNPKRALKLIDEALRYLPNTPANQEYRTHFHDTRGKALLQMGRVSEAVAEFEFALRTRSNNEDILESLITCYNELGLDASPYERKLSSIRQAQGNDQGQDGAGQINEVPQGEGQNGVGQNGEGDGEG